MRTIVDIPQETIDALDWLRKQARRSRAALIRDAIELYLVHHTSRLDERPAFGLWQDRPLDALAYEAELRGVGRMKAVLDTNILIDYLNGIQPAATELQRYTEPIISRITWMEVLAGARTAREAATIRTFLEHFSLQELDQPVAERALVLRRDRHLRLPDAIILATAHEHSCPLVTRNTRDFSPDWPEIRVPYEL